MAAFNYTQPVDATGEQIANVGPNPKADVYPNFNGQIAPLYSRNFDVTKLNDIPTGLLWTAHYGLAGANTITIQFSSPLVSVSTTTSDYTLSGPSAPSISSVTWNAGSRNIILNLSGSLSPVSTYTLAIGQNKVLSGSQVSYFAPKVGTYNWPNLVVDVILPSQIDTIGVGIQQNIVLGDPQMNTAGDAVALGIQQDIDIGTPTANVLIDAIGVGIQQDINLGTPDASPDVVATTVGISQLVSLGTPVTTQQQQPVGVGIAQLIGLGTPIADINPIDTTGTGFIQFVDLGSPRVAGSGNVVGQGIQLSVDLGTPVAVRVLDQAVTGVGINQPISLGTPDTTQFPIIALGVGIDQLVDLGTPFITAPPQFAGVGIAQLVDLGTPVADINPLTPSGVGIDQLVSLGEPDITATIPPAFTGVGIDQLVDLGVPVVLPIANAINAGINQLINLGTPGAYFDISIGVGIQQNIAIGTPRITNPLHFTNRQAATLTDLDDALHKAFGYGVEGGVNPNLIALIPDYIDQFTTLQQNQLKTIFKDTAAAAMVALNIPGTLPNTNDVATTTIAKVTPGGSNGTLTFTDGVLVFKIDPA